MTRRLLSLLDGGPTPVLCTCRRETYPRRAVSSKCAFVMCIASAMGRSSVTVVTTRILALQGNCYEFFWPPFTGSWPRDLRCRWRVHGDRSTLFYAFIPCDSWTWVLETHRGTDISSDVSHPQP